MLVVLLIAVILESLPCGAVCNFAGDGETFRRTFSYFSLTPFGYANFAPFLTAILTCVLLILGVVSLFKESVRLQKAVSVISVCAAVISFAPILYGVSYYSLVGLLISLALVGCAVISVLQGKHA